MQSIPKLGMVVGGLAALLWLERRRPLRRQHHPAGRRLTRNLAVAAIGGATVQLLEEPVVAPLARRVATQRLGLLPPLGLPKAVERAAGVLLMDYTLFVWHYLTHRVPLLWRLHLPHHTDRDMDASTAVRFHALELLFSVPWRAMQVRIIGVVPQTLRLWQRLTFTSILFHHSNVRLPDSLERVLNLVIVTPRMHGLHHAADAAERSCNWSSGICVWDRLHGTYRSGLAEPQPTIGIAGCDEDDAVTLIKTLALPLQRQSRARLP